MKENNHTTSSLLSVAVIACAALSACGTTTADRTVSGAAIGAAGGALIGSTSANAGKGALIGAGAGALGGYLYDQNEKSKYDREYYDRQRAYDRRYDDRDYYDDRY